MLFRTLLNAPKAALRQAPLTSRLGQRKFHPLAGWEAVKREEAAGNLVPMVIEQTVCVWLTSVSSCIHANHRRTGTRRAQL